MESLRKGHFLRQEWPIPRQEWYLRNLARNLKNVMESQAADIILITLVDSGVGFRGILVDSGCKTDGNPDTFS